jgi:tetratricopeptide (TPR) repeat protein
MRFHSSINMRLLSSIVWLVAVIPTVLYSSSHPEQVIKERIDLAYNFDASAFQWFNELGLTTEDPLEAFICASAAYWEYQSDRVDLEKIERVEAFLNRAIDLAKEAYSDNKDDDFATFLYGVGLCNRARFNVEEEAWFSAYRDSRKGISLLKKLLKRNPDMADANFALGVAECFLAEAPAFLKPLAMMLGFSGNAEEGMRKLNVAIEQGKWTSVEAEYYLAYYFYNVEGNAQETVQRFEHLFEKYPSNPIFGYFMARGHQMSHDPLKALEAYQNIRDLCYEVNADDMGNWTSYRIGTILQGEGRHQQALEEFEFLQSRLDSSMSRQFYFQWLPVKFASSLIEVGDTARASKYLDVVTSDWNEQPYKAAKELRRTHNI